MYLCMEYFEMCMENETVLCDFDIQEQQVEVKEHKFNKKSWKKNGKISCTFPGIHKVVVFN